MRRGQSPLDPHIETVWEAARDLPVREVPIEPIQEIDEDCWFRGRAATVRAVVEPAWAITEADLALPVVLASDGQVLDGMHRIAKAVLQRRTTVPARQPLVDPEPDWFLSGEERQ